VDHVAGVSDTARAVRDQSEGLLHAVQHVGAERRCPVWRQTGCKEEGPSLSPEGAKAARQATLSVQTER
jgi:hypothetical protein